MRVCLLALVSLALSVGSVYAQAENETLTAMQITAACTAPPTTLGPSATRLRIIGGQDTVPRSLFGNRDLLVVNGGASAGVMLGQRYYVRRPVTFGTGASVQSPVPRTAGWIRIVAANDTTAIASVDFACEGLESGDYLEPFVAPVIPPGSDRADTSGEPDFSNLGRVLFGTEAHRNGAIGDFMVIDRGSEHGVMPGTRFAVYRDLATTLYGVTALYRAMRTSGVPLSAVGEGVIISTEGTRSVMRITQSRAAVESGDYVVLRR
jgi:hypothetical protein